MSRYRHRTLEVRIADISGRFPALLVTGPRQVGKTTLLRHLAGKDRRYVSLDDPTLRELAASDAHLFFERYPPPLLIDEIQYAPGLLPYGSGPLRKQSATVLQHVGADPAGAPVLLRHP